MNEHVNNEIDQNNPLGFSIRESIVATGYVDADGKFVSVEEADTRAEGEVTFVQDEEDAVR